MANMRNCLVFDLGDILLFFRLSTLNHFYQENKNRLLPNQSKTSHLEFHLCAKRREIYICIEGCLNVYHTGISS